MKLYTLLPLLIVLLCSLVNSLAIPYEDMSDLEIAEMYIRNNRLLISNQTLADSAGGKSCKARNQICMHKMCILIYSSIAIVYPKNNDTWYIGEKVNVVCVYKLDSILLDTNLYILDIR